MADAETKKRIMREVSEDLMRQGKMAVPPDEVTEEEDAAYWSEVERRIAEHDAA